MIITVLIIAVKNREKRSEKVKKTKSEKDKKIKRKSK
jgi:hypothetical protein